MTDDFYARDRAVTEAARGNSPAAQALGQAQNDQWKLEHGGLTAGQVEAYRADLEAQINFADQAFMTAQAKDNKAIAEGFRWERKGLQLALSALNRIDVPLSHPTEQGEGVDQKTSSVSEAIAATNDTMRQLRDAG